MPKSKSINREAILQAAAEVVRTEGRERLSVRAIAGELGCSTQPIYSCFEGGIKELEHALHEEAKRQYHARIESYFDVAKHSRYEAYGMGYVRFAREEKGLFRFLFLTEREERVIDPFFDEIIEEMMALYRMDEQTARAFHTDMAVFSYGLAALVNMGHPLSEEDLFNAYGREFCALYALYLPDRPQFWRK